MSKVRKVVKVFRARPTIEGAGVHLRRAFGPSEIPAFDPFLMLDDFRSDDPRSYLAGFPWHPHRGIETVTYMLEGKVEHGDSLGNAGIVRAGEVQWMTAGSGIIHQEMPKPVEGRMGGLQLWVNLPRASKMMKPRYRDVRAPDIPVVAPEAGLEVRPVAGRIGDVDGPVRDIVCDIEFLDVRLDPGRRFEHAVKAGRNAFAYILEGEGDFDSGDASRRSAGQVALYGDGSHVSISSAAVPLVFLFFSGEPLREPVAWRGPIVMNTQEELDRAFLEYRKGTFIKG